MKFLGYHLFQLRRSWTLLPQAIECERIFCEPNWKKPPLRNSGSRKVYPSRAIISRARGMKYSSKLNARPIARKNPLLWRKLQMVFLRKNQNIGLLPIYSLVLPHRVSVLGQPAYHCGVETDREG